MAEITEEGNDKNMAQKRILLLTTGGTIASHMTSHGLVPTLTAEDILNVLPDMEKLCSLEAKNLFRIDSTNMTCEHWKQIAREIEIHYWEYDGFIVCHGTDTMAYTAAALSYMIQNSPKPIVLTGSQRPLEMEISDARMNLRDSILYVLDDASSGVSLVFGGKIIAGTRAKKTKSMSYNAFSSINFPYIAVIQEEHILFYLDDKPAAAQVRFYHSLNPKVVLLKLIPSMDASILTYMAEHYDAVIIESFGVGGLPSYESGDYYRAVKRLTDLGKTVVMTTQVTNEGSNMSVYEVGKNIKKEFGLLEAYDMTLEAAVTKIMWILSQTQDPQQIRKMFYETVNRDILWKA